ncbi:MAG: hypothetical protein ACRDGQ_10300, partial [Candidatus Limnocylindrales bacterium]
YRSEDRLWEEFENQRPALLGALLDAASAAMAGVDGIQLDDPPRMADFATWIAAACPAMGWDEHEFLRAYAANRAGANETTLDASPLVAPLRKLAQRGFEGSATELLEDLARIVGEGSTTRSTVWPKSPAALSTALRRLAPNLRKGNPPIEVELGRSASGSHIRVLSKGEPGCIGASSASQRHFRHKTEDADDASDDADDADDAVFQANSAGDEFDDDEEPL